MLTFRKYAPVALAIALFVGFWGAALTGSLPAPRPVPNPCTSNHQPNYCEPTKDAKSSFFALVAQDHDAIESLAAVAAVIAGVWLAVVTGYLWGATHDLATSTRELASGAREQSYEMRKTREVAEKQFAVGEAQLAVTRARMRAFVFLEDFTINHSIQWPQGGVIFPSITIIPKWKNSGATPTRNLELRVTARQWEGDLPEGHDYFYLDDPLCTVIGPGANDWSFAQTFENFPADKAAAEEQHTIYVWGEAKYLDVFSETPRFTRFCSRMRVYNIDGDYIIQMSAYGPYNRTDHDGA